MLHPLLFLSALIGRCMSDSVCTVTGPTVVDIHGQLNLVPDRCAYSLATTPDFQVQANFRDRRRKDISFVDSVTLLVGSDNIHLKQGGLVQLNNTALTLNNSAQDFDGVELSKDQTGVTAVLPAYNTSVFFDGNMAQIHVRASPGRPLQGLCGNSSSVGDMRLSEDSGCNIHYNDTADKRINCTKMTEHCKLLDEEPFTACHNITDPEPYIKACVNTLCSYPAVDGLKCQFLEAYSRACSLKGNITLDEWRPKAGCSATKAFCQDRVCATNEFCGVNKLDRRTSCMCRAVFASPYRSKGTWGDTTLCGQNSASLSLASCLLRESDVDYSTLRLKDKKCIGQMDEQTGMVTFNFNDTNPCGTVITAKGNQIIYKNAVMSMNGSSGIITRHDQIYIEFSCFYNQPTIRSMSFKISDSSIVQRVTSGAWNYTLTMKAYSDPWRTRALDPSEEVRLNQRVWVELRTQGLQGDLVAVVIDSCWATNEKSPNASVTYNLIQNGCANPDDRTMKVERNGLGTFSYFSFAMFQFAGSSDIYLHCKLRLCVTQDKSCVPVCNSSRRRRSARSMYEDEAPAFITMAWTN